MGGSSVALLVAVVAVQDRDPVTELRDVVALDVIVALELLV